MKIGELIEKVRLQLADTVSPYLWTNDELFDYLKITINEVYVTCKDVFPKTDIVIQTTAGVYRYPLGSSLYSIGSVICDRISLRFIPVSHFFTLDLSMKGKPVYYSLMENEVYVYPVPDKEYELRLISFFRPSEDIDLEDDIPTEDDWVGLFMYGVMWRAYLKDDTESFSQKALYYESKYKEELLRLRAQLTRDSQVIEITPVHRGLL